MATNEEIIGHLRRSISEGKKPSAALRELFKEYGEIYPVYLIDYLMEAFYVQHYQAMPHLFKWWHDPNITQISDEDLDSEIEPLILEHIERWRQPQ